MDSVSGCTFERPLGHPGQGPARAGVWLWSWVGGISAAEGEVRTSVTVVKTLSKEQ